MAHRVNAVLRRNRGLPSDLTAAERSTIDAVRPFTMTSVERILALTQAVQYLVRRQIAGPVVECGVWRGGSMMAVARTLSKPESSATSISLTPSRG